MNTPSTAFQATWANMLLYSISEGVVGLDREHRITGMNRAAEYLLGWSSEELVGQNVHDKLQARRRDGNPYPEEESPISWLQKGGEFYLVEDVFWTKAGESCDLEISGIVLPTPYLQTYAIVLLSDMSESKENRRALLKSFQDREVLKESLEKSQGQLMQAEKLASVGQLAAGVAHEINNPIGFINSNLGVLKGQVAGLLSVIAAYEKADTVLASHPALLEEINKARKAADLEFLQEDIQNLVAESIDGVRRVKTIVDNLKDFSRVDTAEWQYANLERGLESTLNIVWNEIKYKAEVIKEYAGLPEIECIASQLNQVFMNLLVNAAHAIVEQGVITLRTGFDEKEVWVEVEDTGQGIRQEHLARIFEPFFTTKAVGKGTGLGLSLAYGIVQRHHGRIDVKSEWGKGTAFRVILPRERRDTLL